MRLREIKSKLEDLLVDNQIVIQETANFSGYGHKIDDSKNLFNALELLSKQSWNSADFSPIESIISAHNARVNKTITLDQNEFSQLNSYVTTLNQKLPFFMGVIDSVIDDQSPHDINIKLSDEIKTPKQLQELVTKIEELSKISNIDKGSLEFAGFDKGSDWIILTAIGPATYALVMSGLKLAQEYFKTMKEYNNSKEAKLSYKTALAQGKTKQEFTQEGLEEFQNKLLKIQLSEGVDEIAIEMEQFNGFTENEIKTKLKKTTDCLIKIIEDNNEVHISMNAPKEISESSTGEISIDYSFLEKDKKDVKELNAGEAEKSDAADE